jgi:3-oxoacyl-[acyl-carrier-protein] synthase-3
VSARITASRGAEHARVMSVGSYRPSRVVTNEEICQYIDSSDEWIRERSGIITRRFAGDDETVVSMSLAASRTAIERAGLTASDIDAVVLATVTFPHQTPSAATQVAFQLGALHAAAFDISAACAGFCHGIAMASDMVRGGSARHVLVIGVEKLTDFVERTDRSMAFLFADGAGAVVVGPSETPGIGPTVWGSDGAQWEAIIAGSWLDVRDGRLPWPWLRMDGRAVFKWAVWTMSPAAQKALDAAGVTVDELEAFIPHQANIRIVDAMVKQLGVPDSVAVARDIVHNGNTSAASIPLAMDAMLSRGEIRSGGLALLIGFGAGLAYAGQVIELP